jgi:hypothetical protein
MYSGYSSCSVDAAQYDAAKYAVSNSCHYQAHAVCCINTDTTLLPLLLLPALTEHNAGQRLQPHAVQPFERAAAQCSRPVAVHQPAAAGTAAAAN